MADIDKDKLMELADSLGLGNINTDRLKTVEDAAKKYSDKSEEEIIQELKQLKETLFKDRNSFERQMKAIKEIRPMLNGEQRKKLDKILDLLSKE
ncbi:MAG: hypothetical protein GX285_04220 [Clostridiales bacterium]|nr:hypothetical protein [Clostridiales bacterium]